MLDPLYNLIAWILAFFYEYVPPHNLGISIILLTCTVMLVLFPLTAKQARSMIAMQKVQPEIRRIQQEYKGDRQKMNEEMMKFYQEHKINPLAGCLPLIMQMPVYFALFHVLRHIEGTIPTTGPTRLLGDIEAAGGEEFWEPRFLAMDLSDTPLEAFGGDTLAAIPYAILVGLVVFTGWYQFRQTQARQQKSGTPSPMNAQMQILGKVMPVMFGVFAINFVTGLVLYFVASNTWRIGQQQLVLNKFYERAEAEAAAEKAAKEKAAKEKAAAADGDGDGAHEARPKRKVDPNTSRKKRKKRKR